MKMPFGEYKGWELDAVPDSYLAWLRDQAWLRPQLAEEIDSVLSDKADAQPWSD